jgi:hypothetical protein
MQVFVDDIADEKAFIQQWAFFAGGQGIFYDVGLKAGH